MEHQGLTKSISMGWKYMEMVASSVHINYSNAGTKCKKPREIGVGMDRQC